MSANKTRKSNKNSSTALAALLAADPIFKQMEDGTLKWGDILESPKKGTRKSRSSSARSSSARSSANSLLEDFSVPDLTKRKGIWENFPVILDRIADYRGKERYALVWHKKNLSEWREHRGAPSAAAAVFMEYESYVEYILFHSLNQYTHLYKVLPPANNNQIAILEMVKSPSPRHDDRLPVLRKLNDIKEHFPVVWHAVDGRAGKSTYALELHGKKVRDLSTTAGRNLTADITRDMLAALRASHAWTVLPTKGKEVCRLEIA